MDAKLINTFEKILNLGLTNDDEHFSGVRVRTYNSLLFVVLIFQFIIFIVTFFRLHLGASIFVFVNVIFIISLILLNKLYRVRASIFLFHIITPIFNFLLVLLYNQPNNIEYTFIIFFISVFTLHQGLYERLLMVFLPFVFLIYLKSGYGDIGYLDKNLDPVIDFLILISSVITILVLLLSLAWELRVYDNRIKKLLIELETKNEELIDKNEELERFSYIVSHDMKTPLRAVAGYINILEKKLKGENNENLRYFFYIRESVTQLNNLVVQTLEFSKVEHEKIKLEPVDVNEILFKLSRDFISKDVQVYTMDSFPKVLGNEILINKVFQNLIENGGKYNKSPEKIVEVSAVVKGKKIIFALKDNGIGIDEKYHTQIFEMYKRLHTKKEYLGTGLGLSICKKIAKQLNGNIYLKSKVKEGSTFYFELLLAEKN